MLSVIDELCIYVRRFHFILLIIEPEAGIVEVMDSKSKPLAARGDMADILQR
jgi:hypothetical protein